jgi:hypothetical protein
VQRHARERRACLIVDCAETDTPASVLDSLAGKTGADAANSALYFPGVRASDPSQQNAVRAFPPCGFVAGVLARTDAARGVWKAPAGIEANLIGATGLTSSIGTLRVSGSIPVRSRLPAQLLQPRLSSSGRARLPAQTISARNGVRSGAAPALFLEEACCAGQNGPRSNPCRTAPGEIRRSAGDFMQVLFRRGAFQGATARCLLRQM